MDVLQVSFVCLLMKMMIGLNAAVTCPPCAHGYFLVKNCSVSNGRFEGIQCERCTDCSAAHQETVVGCSMFADSVCRNQTPTVKAATSAGLPVSPHQTWLILTVISLSVFLILLLSLSLTLLACRKLHSNKHHGLNLS